MRLGAGAPVAALLVVAAGCSVAGSAPPAPRPVPAGPVAEEAPPRVRLDVPAPSLVTEELRLEVPPLPAVPHDPILHSPAALDPVFEDRVEHWVRAWRTREGSHLPVYLERMEVYRGLVEGALEDHGLPASLRYLPILESGYSPGAVSRASAVGLWQLMAPTARELGLVVTPLVDERRDPVRSTQAAVRFLAALRARFGSWFLALAAYNGGPSRLERLLAVHAPGSPPADSLYRALGPHLPAETREFVARFLAGARIAMDPAAHGVRQPGGVAAFAYDEAVVPDATTVDVLARLAGTTEEEVRALNPQLLRGVTPKGVPTAVRLPAGSGHAFPERWAALPPGERVTVTEHVVASGETLTHVARRYRVSVEEIRAANPRVRPRALRIGQRLVVPLAPAGGRSASSAPAPPAPPAARAGGSRTLRPPPGVHVVGEGDTLWGIARRYAVAVGDLLRWNELDGGAILRPGQRLRVSPAG